MPTTAEVLQEQLDHCEQRLSAQRPAHIDILLGATSLVLGASIFWYMRRDWLSGGRRIR